MITRWFAQAGILLVAIAAPAIAAVFAWGAVFAGWGSNTYFSKMAAHETPSTVGQGSFDRRFEGAPAEVPAVRSEPAVKIELLGNTPAIKE
jgi:hypothetical protein